MEVVAAQGHEAVGPDCRGASDVSSAHQLSCKLALFASSRSVLLISQVEPMQQEDADNPLTLGVAGSGACLRRSGCIAAREMGAGWSQGGGMTTRRKPSRPPVLSTSTTLCLSPRLRITAQMDGQTAATKPLHYDARSTFPQDNSVFNLPRVALHSLLTYRSKNEQ